MAWIKNEYGDVAVDSTMAAERNIDVKEMLNGCICCTQVGKLGAAIEVRITTLGEALCLQRTRRTLTELRASLLRRFVCRSFRIASCWKLAARLIRRPLHGR